MAGDGVEAARSTMPARRPCHLLHEADAACAKNAAFGIERDPRPPSSTFFGFFTLCSRSAIALAVLHGEFLQLAFSGLIADRASPAEIDEQKLHHALPALARHLGSVRYAHAVRPHPAAQEIARRGIPGDLRLPSGADHRFGDRASSLACPFRSGTCGNCPATSASGDNNSAGTNLPAFAHASMTPCLWETGARRPSIWTFNMGTGAAVSVAHQKFTWCRGRAAGNRCACRAASRSYRARSTPRAGIRRHGRRTSFCPGGEFLAELEDKGLRGHAQASPKAQMVLRRCCPPAFSRRAGSLSVPPPSRMRCVIFSIHSAPSRRAYTGRTIRARRFIDVVEISTHGRACRP